MWMLEFDGQLLIKSRATDGLVCFVPLLTGSGTHWSIAARNRSGHAFCVAPQAGRKSFLISDCSTGGLKRICSITLQFFVSFFKNFFKGPNLSEISSVEFGNIPSGLSGLMTDPGVNRLCWDKWIKR